MKLAQRSDGSEHHSLAESMSCTDIAANGSMNCSGTPILSSKGIKWDRQHQQQGHNHCDCCFHLFLLLRMARVLLEMGPRYSSHFGKHASRRQSFRHFIPGIMCISFSGSFTRRASAATSCMLTVMKLRRY